MVYPQGITSFRQMNFFIRQRLAVMPPHAASLEVASEPFLLFLSPSAALNIEVYLN